MELENTNKNLNIIKTKIGDVKVERNIQVLSLTGYTLFTALATVKKIKKPNFINGTIMGISFIFTIGKYKKVCKEQKKLNKLKSKQKILLIQKDIIEYRSHTK